MPDDLTEQTPHHLTGAGIFGSGPQRVAHCTKKGDPDETHSRYSWTARARAVVTVAKTGQDLAARRGEICALCKLLRLEFTTVVNSAEALGRGLRALEALRLAGIVSIREAG